MKESQNTASTQPKKKYITLKFIIIMIVCMMVGAVVGGIVSAVSDNLGSIYTKVEQWLVLVLPAAQWIWFALSALVSILFYLAARTAIAAYERSGSENEATSTRAEKLLSFGMVSNQLCMILGYGLFGIAASLPYSINGGLLIGVAAVLAIIIFFSAYSTFSVKLLQRLNPEKQGHALSFNFEQEWIASCDEAERMGIYKAAYASYKATNMTLLAVWLVTVIIGMFGGIGIYPIVIVTIIWLVQAISYQVSSIRHSNKLER